ncbi:MAG: protein kinase [Planctomycetes bacterium]|nr:protein kinase [Planctomycetota bacterium]
MSESGDPAALSELFRAGVALELGYLTERQLIDAFVVEEKLRELGMDEGLAKVLVKKNYLTEGQADQVQALAADREKSDRDLAFAKLALRSGKVDLAGLRRAVLSRSREGVARTLGETLVSLGLMSEPERFAVEQVHRILHEKSPPKIEPTVLGVPGEVDQIPAHIGNYEILEQLSRGGMGVVYRARQRSIDRIVALKILASELVESKEFIERFQREARAIGELSHPNIVQVYDYGRIRDLHYIAMEYVDGESLESILEKKGTLAILNAAVVGESVARGLAEANKKGVIHRDVKPDNILVSKEGQVKLSDFGLAKMDRQTAEASDLTDRGQLMGSPYYVAPEQAKGEPVDFRVDMYSLGVTLFRALVGVVPFDAPASIQVIAKHLNAPLPALKDLPRPIPVQAYHLIKWLMAKKPEGRPPGWQKVIELCRELRSAADGAPCPNCGAPLKPGDVICVQCGLNLKTGVQLQIQISGPTSRHRRGTTAKVVKASAPAQREPREEKKASPAVARKEKPSAEKPEKSATARKEKPATERKERVPSHEEEEDRKPATGAPLRRRRRVRRGVKRRRMMPRKKEGE